MPSSVKAGPKNRKVRDRGWVKFVEYTRRYKSLKEGLDLNEPLGISVINP